MAFRERSLDRSLPTIQNTPLSGLDCPHTPPGKPRKMPGFRGHPEVVYTGSFCQNTAYFLSDFDPQNGRFFRFGHTRPDQGEIGLRKAMAAVSWQGRNPAHIMVYFGKSVPIQGRFATTKRWCWGVSLPEISLLFMSMCQVASHEISWPQFGITVKFPGLPPGYWSIASDSRINAGMSAGFLLETRFLSTTTSASTYSAPAFFMSCTSDVQPVTRRPSSTWAVMRSCAAWQISNTGFFLVKNSFANRTASASIRSLSGE